MTRVVIAGAGVIGLAVAYTLRRQGCAVTVVDRAEAGRGCSWGNAGWICPSLSTPLPSPDLGPAALAHTLRRDSPLHIAPRALPALAPWLWRFWRRCNAADYARGVAALSRLNARTLPAYDAWAADGIAFEMYRQGILFAFVDPREAERAHAEATASRTPTPSPPPLLDGNAMRALEPQLGTAVQGGFLVEQDRHVRPESLVLGLVQRVRQLGVELREGIAVVGGTADGHRLLHFDSEHGRLAGDLFVIAAGAWSGPLAAALGVSLDLQAGKGYSVDFTTSSPTFQRAVYLHEAKLAVSPFRGALRVAGTMELSGLNTRMDVRRVGALCRSVQRYVRPDLACERGAAWVGARPITADGLPHIGRLAPYGNVYVATGHGMLGVTLAPATAALLSELMDQGTDAHAPNPFDPAR